MKTTWGTKSKVASVAKKIAAATAGGSPPHRCDPEGWHCDCARRAEINGASPGNWLPKDKARDWLKR